jgi:hypothetical protein
MMTITPRTIFHKQREDRFRRKASAREDCSSALRQLHSGVGRIAAFG